jgi:hypothetical protein
MKPVYSFQEDDVLSPIRDKVDYIRVLMYASRYILTNTDRGADIGNTELKLVIESASRLYFISENKYFSIMYPFAMLFDGEEIVRITTHSGLVVDSGTISLVLAVLDDEIFQQKPSPIDFFIRHDGNEMLGLEIIEELLRHEPSYIRYDHDPKRQNGHLHPLHHLDINYSQAGTYKIGLRVAINLQEFEDILNLDTSCYYIGPAE